MSWRRSGPAASSAQPSTDVTEGRRVHRRVGGGGFWSAAPASHTPSITPETPPSFKRQRRDHSARTPPSQPPQEEDEDEDDAGLWREKICLNAHSASKKAAFKV